MPITKAGKDIIDGACNMVQAAKQLAANPKDPPTYQSYSAHSHSVSEAIKRIVSSIRDHAPAQQECDHSIQGMNQNIHDLDQASLAAVGQALAPQGDASHKACQEGVINAAREIAERIDPTRHAAKSEAEKLGHLVSSTILCPRFV